MTLLHHSLLAVLLIFGQCKAQKAETGSQPTAQNMTVQQDMRPPSKSVYQVRKFSPLQLAIDKAQPFDTITIPPGRYLINTPIKIKTDDLTIICENCELVTPSKQNIMTAQGIRNLTLIGLKASSAAPVSANLLRMAGGTGLSMVNCRSENIGLLFLEKGQENELHENLLIEGCEVNGAAGDGIKLQALSGFKIENSKFIDCTRDGIKTNLAPCEKGIIRKCYFESNGDDAFDLFGGGSDMLIDSSTFVESKLQLKNMGGKDYRKFIKNCTVRHNTFKDATIICLSKYLPDSEFNGLHGIVVDSNTWINEENVCFMTNGAVNYQFTNNNLFIKSGQTAINVRPPLGEGLIGHNTIKSGITYLETNPKKGVYLLHTKKQSDPHFGARDDQGILRIENNTFINGRRDLLLEGLSNYTLMNNVSIAQNDKSIYLGMKKNPKNQQGRSFRRTVTNNKILREPPEKE